MYTKISYAYPYLRIVVHRVQYLLWLLQQYSAVLLKPLRVYNTSAHALWAPAGAGPRSKGFGAEPLGPLPSHVTRGVIRPVETPTVGG
jgi:hypothetical protein